MKFMNPVCRICKGELSEPLLTLKNVPAAAQKMPSTREELLSDKGIDLTICQCRSCGVIQHTSSPVPYFREVIRASGVSDAMRNFRLEQFRLWVKKYGLDGKKVFEAGCGQGEYLSLIAQSGVDVTGWEYGQNSVDFCRKHGLNVEQGFFENGSEFVGNGQFDGFAVLNFLEHIPDISAFFRGIRNNLCKDAVGIVEVPNSDLMLKNHVLTDFSTEHIFYFTEETLTSLLRFQGFEVNKCETVWNDSIISAEVRLRKNVDFSYCRLVISSLQEQLNNFLAAHKKVAFWGCGHQTMTILSVAELNADKIRFIVDSSPAKQDCFTYATHIPIVAPDVLWKSDIDAIIISCGGYSEEVSGIINSKYPGRFKLAVLDNNKLQTL